MLFVDMLLLQSARSLVSEVVGTRVVNALHHLDSSVKGLPVQKAWAGFLKGGQRLGPASSVLLKRQS